MPTTARGVMPSSTIKEGGNHWQDHLQLDGSVNSAVRVGAGGQNYQARIEVASG
jgi:hypothetical protein